MISEIFNPVFWPFILIWVVGGICIIGLVMVHSIVKNLLLKRKDRIKKDIKWIFKVFGLAYIIAIVSFWILASVFMT